MKSKKFVAIAAFGTWGKVTEETQQGQREEFARKIAEIKDTEGEQLYEPQMVGSIEEIERMIAQRGSRNVVVLFTTRGNEGTAESLVKRHPKVRIILASGLPPVGHVTYVPKDLFYFGGPSLVERFLTT